MDSERLRDIEELYQAAREDRAALANASPVLRREVESLLKYDASLPELFMTSTATPIAAGT